MMTWICGSDAAEMLAELVFNHVCKVRLTSACSHSFLLLFKTLHIGNDGILLEENISGFTP